MRKAKPRKRIILPDPKYNDVLVTKFVNNIMLKGKKTIAYNIFYDAIDIVSERSNENGLEVWKKALANVTPAVEVRSRRIGGATFQIPSEIRPERKQSMGMKNLIGFAAGDNYSLFKYDKKHGFSLIRDTKMKYDNSGGYRGLYSGDNFYVAGNGEIEYFSLK